MIEGWFLPALALTTLLLVMAFALWSKRRVELRKEDDDAPKSSLAKDGPGPQPIREGS